MVYLAAHCSTFSSSRLFVVRLVAVYSITIFFLYSITIFFSFFLFLLVTSTSDEREGKRLFITKGKGPVQPCSAQTAAPGEKQVYYKSCVFSFVHGFRSFRVFLVCEMRQWTDWKFSIEPLRAFKAATIRGRLIVTGVDGWISRHGR